MGRTLADRSLAPGAGDSGLLREVDRAWEEAARLAAHPDGSSWLACRPGCAECCHGPFPINALDAGRLRRGLRELAAADPLRAARVAARAEGQLPLLREAFPGDGTSGRLATGDEDEEALETYLSRHGALPCPALDPGTAICDLYAHRPLSCRTYGPPVRIGERDLPPCHLCFVGASPGAIEACRVAPDPEGLEDLLLYSLGEVETLVAFALAGESPGEDPEPAKIFVSPR